MLNKTKLKLLFVSFVLLLSLTAVSANENNTFTDLQTAIDESGNEVNINRDYAYNNTADGKYGDGIVISNRKLVINGNGYAFDGPTRQNTSCKSMQSDSKQSYFN